VLTVLVIVPLRPQRVLTTGMLLWVGALRRLLEAVFPRLDGRREPLRPLVRDVDAAYAALVATATPLRGATFGRNHSQLTEVLCVSSAVRQYARSLAAQAEKPGVVRPAPGHVDRQHHERVLVDAWESVHLAAAEPQESAWTSLGFLTVEVEQPPAGHHVKVFVALFVAVQR